MLLLLLLLELRKLLLLLLPGLEEFPEDPAPGFASVNATEVGADVLLILLIVLRHRSYL